MEGEGEEDGSAEVVVLPWGHSEKRLVFRHTVNGIKHLDGDQD